MDGGSDVVVVIGRVAWSGAGCLVLPLLVAGVVLGAVVLGLFESPQAWLTGVCLVGGFLLSAVLIRVVGRRLNRFGDRHTLYGLGVEKYQWLAVFCAVVTLGIILLTYFAARP